MLGAARRLCLRRSRNLAHRAVSYNMQSLNAISMSRSSIASASRSFSQLNQFGYTAIRFSIIRSFTTASKGLQESRERFTKYMRFLQDGDLHAAIKEMKRRYTEGYRLPKQDVFTVVSQICESKQYGLLDDVISLLSEYDKVFINDHAPIFCYALLLSGDVNKAISLISSTGNAYLDTIARANKESRAMNKREIPLTLPQEYLFSRMCIRMMGDTFGTKFPNKMISHGLRRRTLSESTESVITSSSIISAYLYAALYLVEMNNPSGM